MQIEWGGRGENMRLSPFDGDRYETNEKTLAVARKRFLQN